MLGCLRPFCVLAVVLLAAGGARAQAFGSFVSFGDSLSDSGNYALLLRPAVALPPGSSFTTNPDPVWAEIAAAALGLSSLPSRGGGSNHATGGACVTEAGSCLPVVTGAGPRTLRVSAQLDEYLADGGRADPEALYSVWAGGNDFRALLAGLASGLADAAGVQAGILAAAAANAAQVRRLQDAGARAVVVLNLPDVSHSPSGSDPALPPQARAALPALSSAYNQRLEAELRAREDGLVPVNVSALFGEVIGDPARHGFSDVRAAACGDPAGGEVRAILCGPEGLPYPQAWAPGANRSHMFADDLHPAGATHEIIAGAVLATLAAPMQVSLAGEGGAAIAGAHGRAVAAGARSGLAGLPVGGWGVHAAGGFGASRVDAPPRLGEHEGGLRVATLGVGQRASDDFYWGVAVGLGRHDGDAAGAGLETAAALASLHAAWRGEGGLRLTAAVGAGRASADVERKIVLGAATRVERGSADADLLALDLEAAWALDGPGGLGHGPFAGLSRLDQKIDGYREAGTSSTAMRFSGFDRDSLVVRAGYGASAALAGAAVRAHARVALERELEDDPVVVTAGSGTMPGRFSLAGFAPPSQWARVGVGLAAELDAGMTAVLGYAGRFGSDSRRDHQAEIGLRVSF